MPPNPLLSDAGATRYLELLMGCLTRELFLDQEWWDADLNEWSGDVESTAAELRRRGWRMVRPADDRAARAEGRDWPPMAETMVGDARLRNVADLCTAALRDDVP